MFPSSPSLPVSPGLPSPLLSSYYDSPTDANDTSEEFSPKPDLTPFLTSDGLFALDDVRTPPTPFDDFWTGGWSNISPSSAKDLDCAMPASTIAQERPLSESPSPASFPAYQACSFVELDNQVVSGQSLLKESFPSGFSLLCCSLELVQTSGLGCDDSASLFATFPERSLLLEEPILEGIMALKELLPGAKAPSTYPGNVHLEVPTYQAACAVLSEERMIYNPPLILQKNRSLKLVPKSVIRNPAIPPRAVRPRCASVRIIPTGHNGNTQLGNRQQTGDRMHGKRHSFKVAYPRPLDGISAMRRQSEVIPSDLACPVSRPFFFPKSNNPQPRSKTTQLERVNTEDSFSITSNTENAALSSSKNTHFRYQGSFTQTYAAGCTPWKRLASVLSKIHGSSKRPQRK